MKTICYEFEQSGQFQEIDSKIGLDRWRGREGYFWIDIEGASVEDLRQHLGEVGLDSSEINSFLRRAEASRVLSRDEFVFFELPVHSGIDDQAISVAHFCLERLVITIHEGPLAVDAQEMGSIMQQIALLGLSSAELVCLLLIEYSTRSRGQGVVLREETREMSERMDDDSRSVALAQIVDLKHRMLDLDRTVDEQVVVFDMLAAIDTPYMHMAGLGSYFGVATGNIAAADRGVDRVDKRIGDLQRLFDAQQQDRTNRRLGRLTLISAIFLPLTLIAGIYGMNFENMPELHHPWAYPIAVGAMVVLALGLFLWFRARGWMD